MCCAAARAGSARTGAAGRSRARCAGRTWPAAAGVPARSCSDRGRHEVDNGARCVNVSRETFCDLGSAVSLSWAGGSSRRWRVIRLRVLNRDLWICRLCKRPIQPGLPREHPMSATVHHTLGRAISGDDERYLVAAHRKCNLDVGEPQAHADPEPRSVTRW